MAPASAHATADDTEANCAEYARLVREREALDRMVRDGFAKLYAQIDALSKGAGPALSGIANAKRRELEREEARLLAKNAARFEEITRGVDPETGTLAGVQEDAAELLAAALAEPDGVTA